MPPINFAEYYKTISNTELLSILENPTDYLPEALEAANTELTKRNLSENEIKEIKNLFQSQKAQKEKQQQKIKAVEIALKGKAKVFLDTLNPIQPDLPTTERTIRSIVIVFGLIFLYSVVSNYGLIRFFLHDFRLSPFTTIFTFLPFILLLIAIITFWKRKRIGWTLLVAYLTFSAVITLCTMFNDLNRSGSEFIETFIPSTPVIIYIIQILFLGGSIYIVCRQNIREVYAVSTQKVATTIGATALFSLLCVMAIYF